MENSSQRRSFVPSPNEKAWPPQEPVMKSRPVLYSVSREERKETLAHLRFAPPTRATTCASVM